ncbi:MAG: hypothetical protein IT425_03055 [Pirellulales bacterium]|nr:hypothetical protein [Pirellulales bacterium]
MIACNKGGRVVFLWVATALLLCGNMAAIAKDSKSASPKLSGVRSIDWSRFGNPVDSDLEAMRRILNTSLRYNTAWLDEKYPAAEGGRSCVVNLPTNGRKHEHTIRPAAVVADALAIALRVGDFDETAVGRSREECLNLVRRTIRGLASCHRANVAGENNSAASKEKHSGGGRKTPPVLAWGDHWQSAHWSSHIAMAAWLQWEELDPETQQQVLRMVIHESNRFLLPDYKPHLWANREKVLTPGDTGAEENAWNATILQIAVAMMPRHPMAQRWKESASSLMIHAYATRKDMDDLTTLVDGKPVGRWLQGYNAREDYAVENHGLVHPDYCSCFGLSMRSYLTQSLAREPVPQAAAFNAPHVYHMLTEKRWESPPHKQPGGTIFQPGKAELYYPNGTDWSTHRVLTYAHIDVMAYVMGWDRGRPYSARDWLRLRMQKASEMQARFPNGRTYAPGEFDTYPGAEQIVSSQAAECTLYLWLHAQDAIQPTANWLAAGSR